MIYYHYKLTKMQTIKLSELIATDNQCIGCSKQCKLEFRWLSDHYHEDIYNEKAHLMKKPKQMMIQLDYQCTLCDGFPDSECCMCPERKPCGKHEEL